jgi:hypothetical protein
MCSHKTRTTSVLTSDGRAVLSGRYNTTPYKHLFLEQKQKNMLLMMKDSSTFIPINKHEFVCAYTKMHIVLMQMIVEVIQKSITDTRR